MLTTRHISVAIAVTFLVAPVAAATPWLLGSGSYEPSTTFDARPGYMFQDPNAAAKDLVYFNGLIVSGWTTSLTQSNFNMNLDGGSIMGPVANYAEGLLGYWRDCNRDGYVGWKGALPTSYGSLGTYPTQVSATAGHPVDNSVCPVGSAYQQLNPATGQPNGIINEFREIGPCPSGDLTKCNPTAADPAPTKVCIQPAVPPTVCGPSAIKVEGTRPAQRAPYMVVDNGSRVWGDWERPGGAHVPYQGIIPTPRGTFQDSDGTLAYVDDATLRAISSSSPAVWDSKPDVGACDQPHPVFLGGPDGTCGAWPLYQVVRLGNDTSCNAETNGNPAGCAHPDPLVSVFDTTDDGNGNGNPCDDFVNQSVGVPTTTGTTTYWFTLPDPNPGVNPNALADGSFSGSYKNVNDGTTGRLAAGGSPQCAKTGGFAANCAAYSCEADAQGAAFEHIEPTFAMNFSASTVQRNLAQFGYDMIEDEPNSQDPGFEGGWFTGIIWTARPPRAGWGSATTAYATFYADVTSQGIAGAQRFPLTPGNAATALPAGTNDAHTYGTDFCASITTGPSNINGDNAWECSKTQWDLHRHESTGTQYNPILGDAYDLRDVDCFDNTVGGPLPSAVKAGVGDCTGV